jgi:hypothetical protein
MPRLGIGLRIKTIFGATTIRRLHAKAKERNGPENKKQSKCKMKQRGQDDTIRYAKLIYSLT